MNTRKQVLVMSVLMMISLVVVGIYAAWYPNRAETSAVEFQDATVERGAILFARNCRLCHGDVGEGGALGARLPAAPALHRPDLQGFNDSTATLAENMTAKATTVKVSNTDKLKEGDVILVDNERIQISKIDGTTLNVERGVANTEAAAHSISSVVYVFDAAALKDKVKLITNTIVCGRVGTAMPAWGESQGGPLSDEQIRQLMTLITTGSWDVVQKEVNAEDKIASRLTRPVSDDTTSLFVSDVSVFSAKDAIRLGDERLRVTGVPKVDQNAKDKSGVIEVQRGVLGTTPMEHPQDTTIYKFPETAEPSINQASCGQTARAPAPVGTPGLIEDFTGQTVEVTAQNVQFDKKEITVKTGGQIRVRFHNQDNGVDHNIAFYKSATDTTPVSDGSVGITFKGVATDDTVFAAPAPGSYFFRCDVHPTLMTGTFTVTN